jgi:hypothetical protein
MILRGTRMGSALAFSLFQLPDVLLFPAYGLALLAFSPGVTRFREKKTWPDNQRGCNHRHDGSEY